MLPVLIVSRHGDRHLRAPRSQADRHESRRTTIPTTCRRATPAVGRPHHVQRRLSAAQRRRPGLAIASNCAGQGNMSIVMVLTSLVLQHHGHSLTAIAISHMFHSAGMFAFTIPLGCMADRYRPRERDVSGRGDHADRRRSSSPTRTADSSVTLGTFLVGLGWAAANVAATALIADHAETTNAAARSASSTASPARQRGGRRGNRPIDRMGGLSAAGLDRGCWSRPFRW